MMIIMSGILFNSSRLLKLVRSCLLVLLLVKSVSSYFLSTTTTTTTITKSSTATRLLQSRGIRQIYQRQDDSLPFRRIQCRRSLYRGTKDDRLDDSISNRNDDLGFGNEDDTTATTTSSTNTTITNQTTETTRTPTVLLGPICRLVTRADARLPTTKSMLPSPLFHHNHHHQQKTTTLDKLDAYYHAQAHHTTRSLQYLDKTSTAFTMDNIDEDISDNDDDFFFADNYFDETKFGGDGDDDDEEDEGTFGGRRIVTDREEEKVLVSVVRNSLEDAGFELLSRRDLDLCESLNAGYLLRLSILPDVKDLDPNIVKEFYPERFHSENGTLIIQQHEHEQEQQQQDYFYNSEDELLFDGRVLVYWRGYSEEVTRGRLLLPKIDYLQASLVQRSAAWVKERLDAVESQLVQQLFSFLRSIQRNLRNGTIALIESLPLKAATRGLRRLFLEDDDSVNGEESSVVGIASSSSSSSGRFNLARYGGSKTKFVGSPNPNDALNPFTICEIDYNEPELRPTISSKFQRRRGRRSSRNGGGQDRRSSESERCLYEEINHHTVTCEYDERMTQAGKSLPTMQLLDRVSISNLVDLFSSSGRRKLIRTLFAKSELVEPTYEEVVVIWRPLIQQKRPPAFVPPEFVCEFADMFDIEGFERPTKRKEQEKPMARLEIRNFEGVQMANLPAVLPKTKLVFRPADAFLFDAISFVTFLLVASSIKLDNPRLDLIALVSVSLWLFRTVIRYSNKLARYDLLVKKFLTSKISHRNGGAAKYLASEAGSQRAIRAALVHLWLSDLSHSSSSGDDASSTSSALPLTRTQLERDCGTGINDLLRMNRQCAVESDKALNDLEDLKIITFAKDGEKVEKVLTKEEATLAIKDAWDDLLEGKTDRYVPKRNSQEDDYAGGSRDSSDNMVSFAFSDQTVDDSSFQGGWVSMGSQNNTVGYSTTSSRLPPKSYMSEGNGVSERNGASSLRATLGNHNQGPTTLGGNNNNNHQRGNNDLGGYGTRNPHRPDQKWYF